ncbi:Mitogen-activated protein kinase kinase kinase A [Ananas comosus]|uniref:Mitogen-activated protein kinase kinase kinase A n=1 Tax=Ananas comosus TaxID=4615 RepID=A0A199W044_ANACO|nr:Mitogen-activated protein kinase kinase kinase A [Ananas comosus]
MGREWRRGPTLGRGSSAVVSLATASSSGEAFAVKSAELSRSGPLRREQKILSGLSSPYVVSYIGFDITEEEATAAIFHYYNLFIEYAPGGSLSDEIKRRGGRLDEDAVRSRAWQILRGLAYLHERGVAHCDVKGQNVLIGADGRAMIADLGCARSVTDDDDDDDGDDDGVTYGCSRIRLRGTPMFMAPEVVRGDEQGTAAADVWALGCTVIEMATGGAPWPDLSDPIAALHHIAFSSDVPESPRWMSEEGKDFLSRCLRRDPEERWTAEQLLQHPFMRRKRSLTLDQGFWATLEEEDSEEFEIANTEQIPIPTIDIRTDINSVMPAKSPRGDLRSRLGVGRRLGDGENGRLSGNRNRRESRGGCKE